jgi:serine protease Do
MQRTYKRAMSRSLILAFCSIAIWFTGTTAAFAVQAGDNELSYADLAEEVKHSVVNVFATKIVDVAETLPFDTSDSQLKKFFERFFGDLPEGQTQKDALGSGFIIDRSGLILTNNHVVEKAEEIKVRLLSHKEYQAEVVGLDPKTDLALIQVEPDDNFPEPARLGNSDDIQVGDSVMAAGNPFGLNHSVTVGIISAKGRFIGAGPYDNFLQTDAAINPGNSGGPLFDMKGQVIGVNTAMVAGGQGIGFAVPINVARDLLPMLKKGEIVRGWLGVVIQDMTPQLAVFFSLNEPKGVLIADVIPGGPADKAGLQSGDVILNMAGQKVSETQEITSRVANIKPGTKVWVRFMRDGIRRNKQIVIGTMPVEKAETPVQEPAEMHPRGWGLSLHPLTPEISRSLGMDASESGVVIAEISPVSPAARAGLQPGDIVKEVNRQKVTSVDELKHAMGQAKRNKNLLMRVKRGENTFFTVLEG